MLSIKSVGAVALLLASSVTAQFNYTVDPNTIEANIRSSWCSGQQTTCETLCDSNAAKNDCIPSTFNFTCLCAANNSEPGLQYYATSMPSFLCEAEFALCNAEQVSASGKARCLATEKETCGTLNINNYTPAASESTSSAASSSTSTPTATASGAGPAATTSSSAGLAPTMVASIGTGVFAAGIAAAFGLMI